MTMAETLKFFKILLANGWTWTTLLIGVIVFIFLNPEKVQIWSALIWQALTIINSKWDKKAVANDIQGRLTLGCKGISQIGSDALPYGIKVEWVEETDPESFIEKKEVVVCLNYHRNKDRNLSKAVISFINKGLLPRAKKYSDCKLMLSSDLLAAKKILIHGAEEALDLYQKEILDPALKDLVVEKWFKELCIVDDNGLYSYVLIKELVRMGNKLYPRHPSLEISEEVNEFVEFLYKIASKEKGIDVDLSFEGKFIQTSVVLVADDSVTDFYGIDPYVKRVRSLLRKGISSVYLCAWGTKVSLAKSVEEQIRSDKNIYSIIPRRYRPTKFGTREAVVIEIIARGNLGLEEVAVMLED